MGDDDCPVASASGVHIGNGEAAASSLEENVEDGLTLDLPGPRITMPSIRTMTDEQKWHRLLGHIDVNLLYVMCRYQCLTGLPTEFNINNAECNVCAKVKKSPIESVYNRNTVKSSNILEVIHMYVSDKMRTSRRGNHYYISFVDDYTKYVFTCVISNVSEILKYLKLYVDHVERYTRKKVKNIIWDNGHEYINGDFLRFANQKRIKMRTGNNITGVGFTYGNIILDRAKKMYADAEVTMTYWPECILNASTLLNLAIKNRNDRMTPYEKLLHEKPCADKLKIFGSNCYVYQIMFHYPILQTGKILGYINLGYRVLQENDVLINPYISCFEYEY